MPYRKLIVAAIPTLSMAWEVLKALFAASFAMNPQYGVVLVLLYALDVVMGIVAAARRGVRVPWRPYAKERAYRLVELGVWLAVVLLVTNMSDELVHVQRWALILTATALGGGIVTHHLSSEWQDVWLQVKGRILYRSERRIRTPEGQPDLTEHTVVTTRRPDPTESDEGGGQA